MILKIKEIIFKHFAPEQDRFVLWIPVFLGFGIATYFLLKSEPPFWLGPMGAAGSAGALWFSVKRNQQGLFISFMMAFLVFLGFAVAQWRTAVVAAPVLARSIGPTTVEGRVVLLESRPKGPRVTLATPRIGGIGPAETPGKVRVVLPGSQPEIFPGDWVRLRARLTPPPPPAAPGAYDFQRQLYFSGIGAVGFSFGPAAITRPAMETGVQNPVLVLSNWISRTRQVVGSRVQDAFAIAGKPVVGAVVRALMTGERGSIPEPVLTDFRESGIAHLLAISGLHIGLVAGFVFLGLRSLLALFERLTLHYPIKKIAAVIAIFSALAYALLAGATVPTLRAFLMISIILTAVVFDRRGLSLRLIAFAAFVILIFRPESLLGASFQLSFTAVTALVAAYEALQEKRTYSSRKGWFHKGLTYVGGVLLTTLIAGAATAPLAAYHFNQFADYGVAANLVAVPLTGLWIMPWAVVAFLLMPFGLENLALIPLGVGVDMVIRTAAEVASWPGAVTLIPSPPTVSLAAVALGGLWLCLWRHRLRWFGLSGVVLGLLSFLWVRSPDILIDEKGGLIGLTMPGGELGVSSLQKARFNRDVWLRRAGQRQARVWGEKWGPACDTLGCIYKTQGHTVALVKVEGAIGEDCRRADILISSVPVRTSCPGPKIVIDRFDLWRLGTHALWFEENGWVRVESVNGIRGVRPWVYRPSRSHRPEKGPKS